MSLITTGNNVPKCPILMDEMVIKFIENGTTDTVQPELCAKVCVTL